jgi:cytochrome c-type biogenesis protein CcmH
VAAGFLAVGLNRGGSQPSLDARVMHIAGEVRCPVCDGETVAQSDAAPSLAIRSQIRQDLQAGQSQSQILASLVRSYGPGILEKPQPSGIGLLVWVLPVVAIAGMAVVVVLTISRWRARAASNVPEDEDLEPETSPELDDPPAELPISPAAVPPPGRSRRWWLIAAVGAALVTGGASWAVVEGTSTRLAGQTVSGAALGPQAEAATLQKAQQEETKGQDVDAIKNYEKVLSADPNQPVALTGAGWLLAQTQQPSLLQQGLAMMAKAESADPSYSPAHVYRGITLLSEDDYSDSIPELQWYLAHDPDPQLVAQVQTALQDAEAALKAQTPPTTHP